MRKLIYTAVGAAALATASIANSAIVVNGSSNVDPSTVLANNTADPLKNTLTWGQDLTTGGAFNGSVDFSNNLSGLYSIIVSSSTPGAVINAVTLAGILGTSGSFSASGCTTNSCSLLVPFTGAGSYRIAFGGTAPANGAAVTGNLTFHLFTITKQEKCEMLKICVGAMGMEIRRPRSPAACSRRANAARSVAA